MLSSQQVVNKVFVAADGSVVPLSDVLHALEAVTDSGFFDGTAADELKTAAEATQASAASLDTKATAANASLTDVQAVVRGESQDRIQLVAAGTLTTATPKSGVWTKADLSTAIVQMKGDGNASRTVTVTANVSIDGQVWGAYTDSDGATITLLTWTPANDTGQVALIDLSAIKHPYIELIFTAGGTDVPNFQVDGWGRRGY